MMFEKLETTPLYNEHINLGARMTGFGGWNMPIQYEGIIAEHSHTRAQVSLFDTCHMGEFFLKGPHALKDLSRLVTCNIETLKVGRCRYGFLLNENGGVIDDLITYRQTEDTYLLVVNASTVDKDREWIEDHVSPDTAFADISDSTSKLDLQGPLSLEALDPHVEADLTLLPYFGCVYTTLFEIPAMISRTGYTGELGYELYFLSENTIDIWRRLLALPPIKPAGLGARDTLRLEMGYSLYGHELSETQTPLHAGLDRSVDMNKDFIGKPALMEVIKKGIDEKLVAILLEGRQTARAGQNVLKDGEVIGSVTSGSFAPSLGKAICMAYAKSEYTDAGIELCIDTGRTQVEGVVTTLPFYREGTARKKNT